MKCVQFRSELSRFKLSDLYQIHINNCVQLHASAGFAASSCSLYLIGREFDIQV